MNRFQPVHSVLAGTLLLLALGTPVRAQVGGADILLARVALAAAEADPTALPPYIVRGLGASSAPDRADALHAVVTLAHSAEGVDLGPAIPGLLSIFQTDENESHRILALRALETSAGEIVMEALRREAGRETVSARHPQERRLLFWVLVDHYGVDALRGHADALVASLRADLDR